MLLFSFNSQPLSEKGAGEQFNYTVPDSNDEHIYDPVDTRKVYNENEIKDLADKISEKLVEVVKEQLEARPK